MLCPMIDVLKAFWVIMAATTTTLHAIGAAAYAADDPAYSRHVFEGADGGVLPYRLLRPAAVEADQRYPLVLFLHGAGERGSDNESHLKFGASLFSKPENREAHPAFVVFPQCPGDKYWVDLAIRRKILAHEDQAFEEVFAPPTPELQRAMELVDHIVATEPVDTDRMCIVGLSMGALGTYETLARWPGRFAAAVAICGAGNTAVTERYAKKTAAWITHGTLDEVLEVRYSRRLHEVLSAHGAEVKYTEFPDARHDAWTPTFAMPELLPWLFSHKRVVEEAGE